MLDAGRAGPRIIAGIFTLAEVQIAVRRDYLLRASDALGARAVRFKTLLAGIPLTQADVDKLVAPRVGGPPAGVRLRGLWSLIATTYRSKGNLDCKVTPHPQLDDANDVVNYDVEVDPGPVYHLGFVKFDNVSDQMRTLLIHNWEMLPGDPFDESYVSNFIMKIQQTDPVLKRSLAGVKVKFDADADPHSHDVNVVIPLEKQ